MISIVTPTFNSEKYIEKCIISMMNQQYRDFEHIIVDGGSSDGTIDIIKKYEGSYPLRWISEKDNGMYDALQKGFAMAKGDIFAWINSDDLYYPWTLKLVADIFAKKNIDWLTGIPANIEKLDGCNISYQLPNQPVVLSRKMIANGLFDGIRMNYIQQESCFWTRRLWEQVGGIDTKYRYAAAFHLWKKFAKHAPLYTVHCNLANFRIHETQLSKDIDAYRKEMGVNGRYSPFIVMVAHVYSLINYRKYVINIHDLYNGE